MATIKRYLSKKISQGVAEVYLRVSISRGRVYRIRSGVHIPAARMRDGVIVYPRSNNEEAAALREAERVLTELEGRIHTAIVKAKDVDGGLLSAAVCDYYNPGCEEVKHRGFFDLFDEYLSRKGFSKIRHDMYKSLGRCLHRFEAHRRATRERSFKLDVDMVTADTLMDFERFYRQEWRLYDDFPEIYTDYPVAFRTQHRTQRPQRRGDNVTANMMKMLRAFVKWCREEGYTENRPFDRYQGRLTERYGRPIYLTLEERDRLADFDFKGRPALAVQRDVFVFQCLIGCRVSDLVALRRENVVNGFVEYVAHKTRNERADVVRVPLNSRARAILGRYKDLKGGRLLPFISSQRYNDAIKEMLRVAGIDRRVSVINPTTGETEVRPIYALGSSHMARRTFVGNLYKKVKDPNLVGALSGHKEGSRAFVRYRDIDDDIRRELVDLID